MGLVVRIIVSSALACLVLAGPAPKPTALACLGIAPIGGIETDRMTAAAFARVIGFHKLVEGRPSEATLSVERVIGGAWPARVTWQQDPGCGDDAGILLGQRVVIARAGIMLDPPRLSTFTDPLWRLDRAGGVIDRWVEIDDRRAPATASGLARLLAARMARTRTPDRHANLDIDVVSGVHLVRGKGSPLAMHTVRETARGFPSRATVRANASGDWAACLPRAVSWGQEISVSVGDRSHLLKVPELTASIDQDADALFGVAPPEGVVTVEVGWQDTPTMWESVTVEGAAGPDGRYTIALARDVHEATVQHLGWKSPTGDTVSAITPWDDEDCFLPETSTALGPEHVPGAGLQGAAIVMIGLVTLVVGLRWPPGSNRQRRRR